MPICAVSEIYFFIVGYDAKKSRQSHTAKIKQSPFFRVSWFCQLGVWSGSNFSKLHDLHFLLKHRSMTWIWVQSPEVFFWWFFAPFLTVSRYLNRRKMTVSDTSIFLTSKNGRFFYFCRMGSDDSIIFGFHDFLYVLL